MLTLFVISVYTLIVLYFVRDFRKGLKVHKASFSYMKWGALPRFTVRLSNGRFKTNKVGISTSQRTDNLREKPYESH